MPAFQNAPSGRDHGWLSFYHHGIERRLTNVHGNVSKETPA